MGQYHSIGLKDNQEYLDKLKHLKLGTVVLFNREEAEHYLVQEANESFLDFVKNDSKHKKITVTVSQGKGRIKEEMDVVIVKEADKFLLARLGSFELKYGLVNLNTRIRIDIAIRRYDEVYGIYYTISGRMTKRPFKFLSIDTRIEKITDLTFCTFS